MTPEQIVASMNARKVSQIAVAKRLRVTAFAVNNVIHGRIRSVRIARSIARALGADIHVLWPGQYDYRPRKTVKARPLLRAA